MHRALLLPEIVTAIVSAGKDGPGFLYSCLYVNKLFSHEACRILWKGCYGIFGVGHVSPAISDLGKMVVNPNIGRSRAQFYANLIRVLVFQESNEIGEDALWHPQLRQLQYPLLEDLSIWKTKSAEELNTENVILHYVHSGLRDLRVDASGLLSDHFLEEISRLCPRLQQLDVDFQNTTISQAGLAQFLRRMPNLEGVHVAALDRSWSAEAFAAVAGYQRLKLLHVPAVRETWFEDLLPSNPFPALRQFYALNTTGKALLQLHSANPRLKALHLYNGSLQEAEDVLLAAANFSHLAQFRYQPGPNAAVAAENLVRFVRGCPQLTYLAVGQDQSVVPEIIDMNDNHIHSIAQGLPSLREVHLLGRFFSPPSINAILSAFSQHCPILNRLEVSCGSDWDTCATPQQWLFPCLWTIGLYPDMHMEDTLSEPGYNLLLKNFKQYAPLWFPKVEFFNIIDADSREQELNDFMYEVGYKREYGSDTESIENEEHSI